MGKITVKYFLNTRAKASIIDDGEELYPIYLQVTAKRKNNRIKSQADKYCRLEEWELLTSEESLKKAIDNKSSKLGKALAIESKIIEDLISYIGNVTKDNFILSEFYEIYETGTTTLEGVISQYGELLLIDAMGKDWNNVLQIIDWTKPFELIYSGLDKLSNEREVNTKFYQEVLSSKGVKLTYDIIRAYKLFGEACSFDLNQWPLIYWLNGQMVGEFEKYLRSIFDDSIYIEEILAYLGEVLRQQKEKLLELSLPYDLTIDPETQEPIKV